MDLGRQLLGRDDVLRRRGRDDRRGAGRGHVPRRHQARHRAPSDRRRARRPGARALRQLPAASTPAARSARRRCRSTSAPGAVTSQRRRDRRSTTAAPSTELPVTNRGDRPIQVGSHYHFVETNRALVFDRARGLRHAPRHPRRHRGALRARRDEDRARSWRSPARRVDPRRQRAGRAARSTRRPRDAAQELPTHEPPHRPAPLRRHLRPDDRRPRAARRHRPRRRGRARRHGLRRRVQVRRRQGAARRHGPGGRRRRRPTRSTASSPTRSSSTGPASARPTSASRAAASPASARPATPT